MLFFFLPLHEYYVGSHIKQMVRHLIVQINVQTSDLNVIDVENLIEGQDNADYRLI